MRAVGRARGARVMLLAVGALGAWVPVAGAAQESAAEIVWGACPEAPAAPARPAECATVARPLVPEAPERGSIDLALRRIRGGDGAAPIRLWYLAGGPGDAATQALHRLREVFPDSDIDLYALDHRGTGGSARLGCPEQEDPASAEGTEIVATEWPACMEWLADHRDDLDALTATASARDLGAVIASLADGGHRDFVFGASYGTYLVNRYLQLYPEQPDGVILDGLVPPDWTLDEIDRGLASFGERLLRACSAQPECSRRIGPDPFATTRDLSRRFDEGHCADLGVDGATIRLLLGNLAMGGSEIWPWIPPLVYRLDRCRLRDMLAVGALVENLFESGGIAEDPSAHAPVLQRHVALSEMWPEPPPARSELEAIVEEAAMTTAIGPSFATTLADWPRYEPPGEPPRVADYPGPALLLHGGLDPTMPVDRLESMLEQWRGAAHTFVLFPDRGHVVLNENSCAREIYRAFLRAPGDPPPLSCVAERGLDPLAIPTAAESPFDTDDTWGESPSSLELQLLFFASAAIAVATSTAWFFWRRRQRRRARA